MDTISVIHIPKKGNLSKCQNYRMLSLIIHTSNILLRIILNRMNIQVEQILAEEHAVFRTCKRLNKYSIAGTLQQVFDHI